MSHGPASLPACPIVTVLTRVHVTRQNECGPEGISSFRREPLVLSGLGFQSFRVSAVTGVRVKLPVRRNSSGSPGVQVALAFANGTTTYVSGDGVLIAPGGTYHISQLYDVRPSSAFPHKIKNAVGEGGVKIRRKLMLSD